MTSVCPECSANVDAKRVFDENACPHCGESIWTFFDDGKPDPDRVTIQRNHDGSVEVSES